MANPPALPPRASSANVFNEAEALPAYTELDTGAYASLAPDDPRTSSAQSLRPEDTPQHDDRRTLLLVYIHGFMGAETSFQSFPLHVHRYLTLLLADSCVIHTKIYPRYRSKRQIQFARDDFSKWLAPHESPKTDIVLLGHSMGGLLAAEVALMPATAPTSSNVFKHAILGTINFDVPFLGMHPGVVGAGLSSIFRGKSPERKSGRTDTGNGLSSPSATTISSADGATLSPATSITSSSSQPPKRTNPPLEQTDQADPNFNPKFKNDVNLPMRKGWNKALHFINKHSDSLIKSSQNLIKSHMEFGGAMADYSGLKVRYNRLRILEDEDEDERRSGLQVAFQHVPRVRFVNYYTASSGRPKTQAAKQTGEELRGRLAAPSSQTLTTNDTRASSRSQSPRISVEEVRNDGELLPKDTVIPQVPSAADEENNATSESSLELGEDQYDASMQHVFAMLPEIPLEPQDPGAFDSTRYENSLVRNIAQRQHSRDVRAYKQAVRHRNAALADRAKLEARLATAVNVEHGKRPEPDAVHEGSSRADKTLPSGGDEEDILERYRQAEIAALSSHHGEGPAKNQAITAVSRASTARTGISDTDATALNLSRDETTAPLDMKKKKDRQFCMLPGKNAQGQRDPTWVRIFMKDIDEVTAHCGLFMQDSETYELLIGEVGQKVEEWVRDDMTRRVIESHA